MKLAKGCHVRRQDSRTPLSGSAREPLHSFKVEPELVKFLPLLFRKTLPLHSFPHNPPVMLCFAISLSKTFQLVGGDLLTGSICQSVSCQTAKGSHAHSGGTVTSSVCSGSVDPHLQTWCMNIPAAREPEGHGRGTEIQADAHADAQYGFYFRMIFSSLIAGLLGGASRRLSYSANLVTRGCSFL